MKTVAIWGISPEIRLKLKLLAITHDKTMASMVSDLVVQAYEQDDITLTETAEKKAKHIIKKYFPSIKDHG